MVAAALSPKAAAAAAASTRGKGEGGRPSTSDGTGQKNPSRDGTGIRNLSRDKNGNGNFFPGTGRDGTSHSREKTGREILAILPQNLLFFYLNWLFF